MVHGYVGLCRIIQRFIWLCSVVYVFVGLCRVLERCVCLCSVVRVCVGLYADQIET